MILSKALALGLQLMVPVAANADDVPKLNVEQVCEGIAKQGGVTFMIPRSPRRKRTVSTASRRSVTNSLNNGPASHRSTKPIV